MKKKLFFLFFVLWINLIFIKNEVIPHDDLTTQIPKDINTTQVNETSLDNINTESIELKNITSTNSTNFNNENTTDINIKETENISNVTLTHNETEAYAKIDNNTTDNVNNESITNNKTLESNNSNETSSNVELNLNTTQVSTDSLNEKTSSNVEDHKPSNSSETSQERNIEEQNSTSVENKPEETMQQKTEIIEEQKEKKKFNLTEEIEKLYQDREKDSSSHAEDNYIDDHNSDYYENIEEVRAKEEEEEKLRKEREEEDKLREEWQKKVSDFTAQDLLTIKLKRYSTYKFYEDVHKVPSKIRVAFFVNNEYKKVNFEILEPNGKSIFVEKNKAQSYFEFETKKPGVYKFVLTNHDSVSSLKVSFALHAGENVDSNLKSSHLDEFSKHLKHVHQKIKELKFTHRILNKKYDGHHETTLVHNYRIRFYSILETTLMCIILILQLFYIKNLIKDY